MGPVDWAMHATAERYPVPPKPLRKANLDLKFAPGGWAYSAATACGSASSTMSNMIRVSSKSFGV